MPPGGCAVSLFDLVALFGWIFFLFGFGDGILQYSPGYPGACHVDQADFKHALFLLLLSRA